MGKVISGLTNKTFIQSNVPMSVFRVSTESDTKGAGLWTPVPRSASGPQEVTVLSGWHLLYW